MDMEGAKSVKTPGEDEPTWKLEGSERILDPKDATLYRMFATRTNCLSSDRIAVPSAIKECCHGMVQPTEPHLGKLKRLARYLVGRPGMVWKYHWQPPEDLKVYSDSDWAGCMRTVRSTSCGVVMRGKHHIKRWSVTQKKITPSSVEAELSAHQSFD